MKVMITGAAGFVGAALTKKFLQEGHTVVACYRTNFDRLVPLVDEYGNRLQLKRNAIIGEAWSWPMDAFQDIELVVDLAWCGTSGPGRMDYGEQTLMAQDTATFMEICYKRGVNRFVGVGSIAEFEVQNAVHDNRYSPSMSYCYALGKSLAHGLCKCIASQEQWQNRSFVWPMLTNAYGPGEESPRLVNTTIKKILNNEKLEFSAGTQCYDFVYIDDVADAIYAIAMNGKKNYEYVIGSGEPQPLRNYLEELIKVCDPKAKPHFGALQPGYSLEPIFFVDNNLEKDTGWRPKVSFAEGIARTKEWIANPQEGA